LSKPSIKALDTLDQLAKHVERLEAQIAAIVPGDPKFKDQIGGLFGTVEKLLEQKIDAVSTTDLQSGKQTARLERKDLVKRTNALLDKLLLLRDSIPAHRPQAATESDVQPVHVYKAPVV
jgi:hypothetical protein